MKVDLIEKTKESAKFVVSGITPAVANAIRRAAMFEVPMLAVEDVTIYDNTSAMFDEMLAHRLGLVPLLGDMSSYTSRSECSCKGEGCASCSVVLTLHKRGSGVVYSQDMVSLDPKVKPMEDIPLLNLSKGQKVKLEAVAQLGVGKDHVKWCPGLVVYRNVPKVSVNKKKCDSCGICVEDCPKKVFESKKELEVKKEMDCTLCGSCVEKCPKGAISVEYEPNDFIFTVETHSALKPFEIMRKSLDVLSQKSDVLADMVKKLKSEEKEK